MPLVAIYDKTCAAKIERWLAQDKRRAQEFVTSVKLKTITLPKEIATQLRNINTPKQLKEIKHAIAD